MILTDELLPGTTAAEAVPCDTCGVDVPPVVQVLTRPLLAGLGPIRAAWLADQYGKPVRVQCAPCCLAALSSVNKATREGV